MNNDIKDRSLVFGIEIAKYYLSLKEKKYYEIASQLFRSGTSIGANIAEAKNSPSKKDFINKLHISLKEGDETLYRLEILEKGFGEDTKLLKNECKEIVKILVTIIKKTKNNQQ
ncbi:MAG TPA: four helix bundle protein [Candidatus Absconditabacterales bacterium]|nr:four helix bundle protein [Candidatus Absconditabacterales bacterium]